MYSGIQLCLLVLVFTVGTFAEEVHNGDAVKQFTIDLTPDNFKAFIVEKGVRVVFAFKPEEELGERGIKAHNYFLREYEKSAEVLSNYDSKLAKIDCSTLGDDAGAAEEYCNKPDASRKVQTFRNGVHILDLSQENMFDVNSIMSNILQIVLLRQVPILQTREERDEVKTTHAGSNFLFSFQQAIGTYEHRIFMEVAYAFQDSVTFGLTTEKHVVSDLPRYDISDTSGIWLLSCKKDGNCEPLKYIGTMDLSSLSRWMLALELPAVHDVVEDGDSNPYEDSDIDVVTIFYDHQSAAEIREEVSILTARLRGLIGVVMVNTEEKNAMEYGLAVTDKIPALTFKSRTSESVKFMPYNQMPLRFVVSELNKSIKGLKSKLKEDLHALGGTSLSNMQDEDDEIDDEENMELSYMEAVETQDDQVAEAVARMKKTPLDLQHVPALTDVTFPEQTKNSDLLVVLFYLKFDARSMAFLRSYVEASSVLAAQSLYPLAAVDCYDWTDVCGKSNVTIYPSVSIFRKERDPVSYKGLLGAAAIVSTVKLYMAENPAVLTSVEQAKQFVAGQLPPNMDTVTHVSVLGLFDLENKQEMSSFKEASQQSEGKFLYGYASGDLAKQLAAEYQTKTPSVVVIKRNDPYQPYVDTRQRLDSASRIVQFVSTAALPLVPQLTATSFPAYFAQKKPFVILFHQVAESQLHDLLGELAKAQKFPEVILSWMNAQDKGSAAAKVLAEYDPKAKLPVFALVNHNRGTVHLKEDIATVKDLEAWMLTILNDDPPPTRRLKDNKWKPLNPGYDFLRLIDLDVKSSSQKAVLAETDPDYDPFSDEAKETSYSPDDEAREGLHMLRNTRIYQHHKIRSKKALEKAESHQHQQHQHTEL